MNKFFSQLKKETQEVRLSDRERETMRRTLEKAFASSRPVKSPIQLTPSPLIFVMPRLASSLAFVLILAVVSGTTAYGAEGAVPGDLLYPMKIQVNEKVVAAFAVSPEAKAEVHASFAERRIQEAENLTARGVFTAEAKEELEANLDEHMSVVAEAVAQVEEEDPVTAADISTRFESSLSAHSAIIERLSREDKDEESRNESGKFARILKERGQRLASASRGISVKAERGASGEIELQTFARETDNGVIAMAVVRDSDAALAARLEANASTTLDEAEAEFMALRGHLDATTSAQVQAQIGRIRSLIEKFRREKGSMSSEKAQIERVFKDAVMVKAFIEAQQKFQGHTLLPAVGVAGSVEDDSSGDSGERKGGEDHGDEGPLLIPTDAGVSL